MKTDLLLSWANRIEAAIERQQKREPAKRIGFNMGSFMSSNGALTNHANYACGTTACLAGWILHLDYDLENEYDFQVFLRGVGARNSLLEHSFENLILDRVAENSEDRQKIRNLFGIGDDRNPTSASPKRALAVMRNLAYTGYVEWNAYDNAGQRIDPPKEDPLAVTRAIVETP